MDMTKHIEDARMVLRNSERYWPSIIGFAIRVLERHAPHYLKMERAQ